MLASTPALKLVVSAGSFTYEEQHRQRLAVVEERRPRQLGVVEGRRPRQLEEAEERRRQHLVEEALPLCSLLRRRPGEEVEGLQPGVVAELLLLLVAAVGAHLRRRQEVCKGQLHSSAKLDRQPMSTRYAYGGGGAPAAAGGGGGGGAPAAAGGGGGGGAPEAAAGGLVHVSRLLPWASWTQQNKSRGISHGGGAAAAAGGLEADMSALICRRQERYPGSETHGGGAPDAPGGGGGGAAAAPASAGGGGGGQAFKNTGQSLLSLRNDKKYGWFPRLSEDHTTLGISGSPKSPVAVEEA